MENREKIPATVTVLMPVYNAGKYLAEAIQSILDQTYTDFELLMINDGSTDDSEAIIQSFKDPRIVYVKNEENIRLVATLNKGLAMIQSRYIVRMDADDISTPNRISRLVDFMEKNSEVDICGSYIKVFGKYNAVWKYELQDRHIRPTILFGVPVGHASCIFRNSTFKKHHFTYSEKYIHLEDYDLWLRVFPQVKFASVGEVLYEYRILDHNVTTQNWESRRERIKNFYRHLFQAFKIPATDEEINLHVELGKELKTSWADLKKYKRFLRQIEKINAQISLFDRGALRAAIHNRWSQLYFSTVKSGFGAWLGYVWLSKKITWTQARYFLAVKLKPVRHRS